MLSFDGATHAYTVNNRRLPSVTQVMDSTVTNYAGIPPAVLEYKSELGRAVHVACELYDNDDLDESTIDPLVLPYLNAWKQFISETGFVVQENELPLHSDKYRYAGTLDKFGELGGDFALVDLKTVTVLSPATGIQLAGYEQLLREHFKLRHSVPRYAVQLRPDGTYRMQKYDDPNDFAVFLACLQINNFKVKHGYKS